MAVLQELQSGDGLTENAGGEDSLLKILEDKDASIEAQTHAMNVLRLMPKTASFIEQKKSARYINAATKLLKNPGNQIVYKAAGWGPRYVGGLALGELGTHGYAPLVKVLEDKDLNANVRATAARAMEGFISNGELYGHPPGTPLAVTDVGIDFLMEYAQNRAEDSDVRREIVDGLVRCRQPIAAYQFFKLLQDPKIENWLKEQIKTSIKFYYTGFDERGYPPLMHGLIDNLIEHTKELYPNPNTAGAARARQAMAILSFLLETVEDKHAKRYIQIHLNRAHHESARGSNILKDPNSVSNPK